jgi:hypothetical protein
VAKTRGDFSLQIKQRMQADLFAAISLLFESSNKIHVELGLYGQFSVSSVKHIEQVINLFSFSNHHPLVGHKLLQYEE